MRTINVVVADDDFDELSQVKGDRSWREAIKQEFGVDTDE